MVTGEFRIAPNAYMTSSAPLWLSGDIDSGLGESLQRNFGPNHYRVHRSGPDGRIIIVSLLVFLVFSGSLAGLPWIHWSKRFTLRTLLIAVTAVAVVWGWWCGRGENDLR
jgi:hypothetical protein